MSANKQDKKIAPLEQEDAIILLPWLIFSPFQFGKQHRFQYCRRSCTFLKGDWAKPIRIELPGGVWGKPR